MSDWTDGYLTDIGYTYGYYTELNPLRIRLAFLNQGLVFPQIGSACELGFGQGLAINFHGAGSTTRWHGTDFMPDQAGFARELASASGTDIGLHDDAFADFASRPDVPGFDYIGLHGIWSWISDENRSVIVDFIRRKLNVGGVLYISYNTLPGWSSFAPIRHIMTDHVEKIGARGNSVAGRINEALAFAEKLLSTASQFNRASPLVSGRLEKIKEMSRQYLAHEYFNRDWCPMYFSDVAELLKSAKIQFATSASYLDHVDLLNLQGEQRDFLNGISDPVFRETTRDFLVNQQFRRDYWVKGARRLSAFERLNGLRAHRILLTSYRPDISLKISCVLGEANMNENVYVPILDILSDHKIRSLGQIETEVRDRGISLDQIVQAVVVLAGVGHLVSVQDDAVISKARKQTDRLNAFLCGKARGGSEIAYLASPVTGGGVPVDRFQQLFVAAIAQGRRQPADWAQSVWQVLASQGQRLTREGKPLEAPEDNLAELTAQAERFAARRLPALRALQVA